MPRRRSMPDSRSDFSTDTVPTRTGRPAFCCSVMSLTIASYFSRLGLVDEIGLLDTAQRPIRRDDDDIELVDLRELLGLGVRRAGHAGELVVLAEVVLERDGRERLVLTLDLDLLLRFDGLVQPVAPAPARHQAARELVDDHDLAVLDDVVHVALEQRVRPQRLLDVVEQRHVRRVVETAGSSRWASSFSALAMPLSVSVDRLVLLVDDVVACRFERFALLGLHLALRDRAQREPRNDAIDFVVQVGRFLRRARDDQRRARFVDQDAVDLVDDREVVPALHVLRRARTSCCRAGSRSRTRCWCRR